MKTSTGILLVLASTAGAVAGAALTRRRSRATKFLAIGAGFIAPWGLRAAFAQESTTCTVLFITDTHGSGAANAALVRAMLREEGIDHVVGAGDVSDRADYYPEWWDRPFREVEERWPVSMASGNHDHYDNETYAEFVERFGEEPKAVVCGNAEFFVVPWGTSSSLGRWLSEKVAASTAKWKILVTHRPLWYVDGGGQIMRDLYADSLPYIDLVLAGHQHISWDSIHTVDGHRIRQILDVSGPKKYDCPSDVPACIQDETAYWRIEFGNEIRAVRKVVG